MIPAKAQSKYLSLGLVIPAATLLCLIGSQPCHAQSGGDAFSSQGISGGALPGDYWESPRCKELHDDPFDPDWVNIPHADDDTLVTVKSTGDPFMDSCLFGGHHIWYRRTYCEFPVFADATPWWQDYLDKAERFGCCNYKDQSGKPVSKTKAISLLLKETNISKTRPLRYTLRALWQTENDDRDPSAYTSLRLQDETLYQRLRGLYLSASQQSTLPIMRVYYRARAFACCDEPDQLHAALRRLRSLTNCQAAFRDISTNAERRQRFEQARIAAGLEKN